MTCLRRSDAVSDTHEEHAAQLHEAAQAIVMPVLVSYREADCSRRPRRKSRLCCRGCREHRLCDAEFHTAHGQGKDLHHPGLPTG
jgi:hypothetical protein